jgi:hypothetical protein
MFFNFSGLQDQICEVDLKPDPSTTAPNSSSTATPHEPLKKRGRPRKGFERPRTTLPPTQSDPHQSLLPLTSKRVRRSPKKLEEYVNVDLPPQQPDLESAADNIRFVVEDFVLNIEENLQEEET